MRCSTRRRVISCLTAVCFPALSGCVNDIINEDYTGKREICELTVDNQDDRPHQGVLEIRVDSKVVFERQFELQGAEERGSSFTINKHLPIKGQPIEVFMEVDDRRSDSWSVGKAYPESVSAFITISESRSKFYFSSECSPSA